MSYEKQDNSGTLGKNNSRTKETHPEYSGACTINGKGYWINAWVKTNRESGEKFFSLSFKEKLPLGAGLKRVGPPLEPPPETQGPDDQIPF